MSDTILSRRALGWNPRTFATGGDTPTPQALGVKIICWFCEKVLLDGDSRAVLHGVCPECRAKEVNR